MLGNRCIHFCGKWDQPGTMAKEEAVCHISVLKQPLCASDKFDGRPDGQSFQFKEVNW